MATWLFQANPNQFNIDGFLETRPNAFSWMVTRQKGQIDLGDQVFLWRAAGSGKNSSVSGVIAETIVVGPVTTHADNPASIAFWRDPNRVSAICDRVPLRVIRVAGKAQMISRASLLNDPILGDLTILRMANQTNFLIPTAQAVRLNALWSKTGND